MSSVVICCSETKHQRAHANACIDGQVAGCMNSATATMSQGVEKCASSTKCGETAALHCTQGYQTSHPHSFSHFQLHLHRARSPKPTLLSAFSYLFEFSDDSIIHDIAAVACLIDGGGWPLARLTSFSSSMHGLRAWPVVAQVMPRGRGLGEIVR